MSYKGSKQTFTFNFLKRTLVGNSRFQKVELDDALKNLHVTIKCPVNNGADYYDLGRFSKSTGAVGVF